jgi:hypothetical protein
VVQNVSTRDFLSFLLKIMPLSTSNFLQNLIQVSEDSVSHNFDAAPTLTSSRNTVQYNWVPPDTRGPYLIRYSFKFLYVKYLKILETLVPAPQRCIFVI